MGHFRQPSRRGRTEPSLLFCLRCSSSGGRESRPLPRSRLLSAPNPLLRRTPSGEDQESRKQILRQTMEGFSLSMSSDSFYEEWMDLQDIEDIVTKDLEEKNLGDLDFAGLQHWQQSQGVRKAALLLGDLLRH